MMILAKPKVKQQWRSIIDATVTKAYLELKKAWNNKLLIHEKTFELKQKMKRI